MGKIKKLKDVELVGGTEQSDVYPITSTKAIYDENNKRLDNIIAELQKSADSSLETENKTIVGSINELKRLLDEGYLFKDVATTKTNPGTPDAKVFYIANGKGTYTNFGGIEVTEDEVVVLYWDTAWHKVSTGIASNEKLSELESKTEYYLKGGAIENSYITGYIDNSGVLSDIGLEKSYGLRYISVIQGNSYLISTKSPNAFYPLIAFTESLSSGASVEIIEGQTQEGQIVDKFFSAKKDGYLVVWVGFTMENNTYFSIANETPINKEVGNLHERIKDCELNLDETYHLVIRTIGLKLTDGFSDLEKSIANNFIFIYAKTERALGARVCVVYNSETIVKRIYILDSDGNEIFTGDNTDGIQENNHVIFLYDWNNHSSQYNLEYNQSKIELSENIEGNILSKIDKNTQAVSKLKREREIDVKYSVLEKSYVENDKTILEYSGSNILYYKVIKGISYNIHLESWSFFAEYPAITFCKTIPQIGNLVDSKIYQSETGGTKNYETEYTPNENGYICLSQWQGTSSITYIEDYNSTPVAFKDYKPCIQIFGDSISDNRWLDYITWVDLIPQYLNFNSFKVVNSAIGGSHLASNTTGLGDKDSGVWNVIEKGLNKYNDGTGVSTSALKLQGDTNLVIIFAGTNDFNDGYALGKIDDPVSEDSVPLTICSAVKRILHYIFSTNPTCKVLWVAPIQRYNITDTSRQKDEFGRTVNNAGWTLQEANNIIAEVCSLYSVPCLKMYDILNINETNINTFTIDGLHPNIEGDKQIASLICSKIFDMVAEPVFTFKKNQVNITLNGGSSDYSDIIQVTPYNHITETSMINYSPEGMLNTYSVNIVPDVECLLEIKRNNGVKYSIISVTGNGVTYSNDILKISSNTDSIIINVLQ